MIEYKKQLEACSWPSDDKGTKEYFEKFWLFWKELVNDWTSIHNNIFNRTVRGVPDRMFKDEFELKVGLGGSVLYEDLFNRLRNCMEVTEDNFFVVVEHHDPIYPVCGSVDGRLNPLTPFRFRYAADVDYEDVRGGELLNFMYVESCVRNFYIFGDSGNWGLYLDLDNSGLPLEVVGFKKEYAEVFEENFSETEENKQKILPQLDDFYQQFV